MLKWVISVNEARVALLAEGVDRNSLTVAGFGVEPPVALLAEGVDRNTENWIEKLGLPSRPPRGGRG